MQGAIRSVGVSNFVPSNLERIIAETPQHERIAVHAQLLVQRGALDEFEGEVERLAAGCRFADCRHLREPACAVRSAAEVGALAARRYESYRRLRRLYEELTSARGPGRG